MTTQHQKEIDELKASYQAQIDELNKKRDEQVDSVIKTSIFRYFESVDILMISNLNEAESIRDTENEMTQK